jgi:hypothetical protein
MSVIVMLGTWKDSQLEKYEERRYCMGIVVGFGENTAWDTVTLLDYVRWYDRLNAWGDV